MDSEQILKLYDWDDGICFRHRGRDEVPTTLVWTVRPAAGGIKDVRACEECVLIMEDTRRRAAERMGTNYEPGHVAETSQ
ncbi:hypothetical protein [Streptomyces sp. NPDC091299]|uniref:hypothetical protein n=1 Tax=Streptomyces sp. NPDC091299 TaxID=3155302 RepID=UPI00342CA32F